MTDEKNIDELTELLMEIDQHQVCFARNLFPRLGWRMECRFSEDESLFLYLVFDGLHNIPELEIQLVQIKKDGSQKANEFLVNLVLRKLSELHGLITSTDKRKEYGIKDTNKIQSWCHCELKRIREDVEQLRLLQVLDSL